MTIETHDCDKCGKPVAPENSALMVEELATGVFAGFVKDRHLYPEKGCPGSPSRVQLVESDPLWRVALDNIKSTANDD